MNQQYLVDELIENQVEDLLFRRNLPLHLRNEFKILDGEFERANKSILK